jgi:uncharacterized membrane protein
MANYQLINFVVDILRLFGIACSIPFGTMMHLAMSGNNVSIQYIIASISCLLLGIVLILIACIILKRYFNHEY